eukprot:267568-Prymnesium_polylepis.1
MRRTTGKQTSNGVEKTSNGVETVETAHEGTRWWWGACGRALWTREEFQVATTMRAASLSSGAPSSFTSTSAFTAAAPSVIAAASLAAA